MEVISTCKDKQIFGTQHLLDKIDEGLLCIDIKYTYSKVVEFIKWYNINN